MPGARLQGCNQARQRRATRRRQLATDVGGASPWALGPGARCLGPRGHDRLTTGIRARPWMQANAELSTSPSSGGRDATAAKPLFGNPKRYQATPAPCRAREGRVRLPLTTRPVLRPPQGPCPLPGPPNVVATAALVLPAPARAPRAALGAMQGGGFSLDPDNPLLQVLRLAQLAASVLGVLPHFSALRVLHPLQRELLAKATQMFRLTGPVHAGGLYWQARAAAWHWQAACLRRGRWARQQFLQASGSGRWRGAWGCLMVSIPAWMSSSTVHLAQRYACL